MTVVWEPGISGWASDWQPAIQQIERHRADLASLVGARLVESWIVMDGAGEWFADSPVVLQFDDGRQLEICWQRDDDLSLTWGTIDLDVKPTAWVADLTWRSGGHPALLKNQGGRLMAVASTHEFLSYLDEEGPNSHVREHLTCTGLWLAMNASGLHVFNNFDENGLSSDCGDGHLVSLF